MANWSGSARSNYFAVKNEAVFRNWAHMNNLQVFTDSAQFGLFALSPSDEIEYGGWPSSIYEGETYRDFDLFKEIVPHLADSHIAVFMQIGAEKLRYLSGDAYAVNNAGKCVDISLNDIYALAKQRIGGLITKAEF